MAKIGTWSTTAGNNNATPPDGWPEGQAPSTVNDCAREMMASVRTAFEDLQYVDQGFSPTYISATSFSVTGNQTSAIHAGRRLKIYDATAGGAAVFYASVTTASFTAVTTIHVVTDAGVLTSSLSSFAVSIISNTNSSLPKTGVFDTIQVSATSTLATVNASGNVIVAGTTRVKNGTVSAPALIMDAGDTDTGFYWINNGAIGFATDAQVGARLSSGGLVVLGDVTAFSDERLKTNWRDLQPDFITKLAETKMGIYERIDTGITQVGVSAQSFKRALPEAIHEDEQFSVAYGNAALAACVALAREILLLRKEIREKK